MLEAEAYASVAPDWFDSICEPASDGRHVEVVTAAWAATPVVQMATKDCDILFGGLALPPGPMLARFRLAFESPSGQAVNFALIARQPGILGSQLSLGVASAAAGSGLVVWDGTFHQHETFPEGLDGFRLGFFPSAGYAQDVRVWIDRVEFEDMCEDTAPQFGVTTADGMVDGFHGWAGTFGYTFRHTGARDAEGDPLTIRWTFPGNISFTAPVASRSFPFVGVQTIRVDLIEDLSWRCAGYAPRTFSINVGFQTHSGWTATLLTPTEGRSCVASVWQATPQRSPDLMSGRCALSASVADVSAALAPSRLAQFRVDGVAFATGTGATLGATYDSARHLPGPHVLDACFRAQSDRHARLFCTDDHDFVSVPVP